jgi:general secretion pathway protein K
MEDYSFFTRITNHAGLIDLNAAGIGLLSIGFQSLRLPAPQAETLARAVDYYRRMDRQPLDSELATLIGSSGYKRAAFEDVVELRDFTDLKVYSPEVLSNVFTVHSRRGTIARDLAPPELRAALSQASNTNQLVQSQNAIGDALTGEMIIYRHQKLQFATSVVFALTADDARMLYAPTVSYAPDDNERNFDGVSNCEETFGGETVSLLREVLG